MMEAIEKVGGHLGFIDRIIYRYAAIPRRCSIEATMFTIRRNVGFVTNVSSRGGRAFSKFTTVLLGNSNAGHVYGTTLPLKDKTALIEYLKTF